MARTVFKSSESKNSQARHKTKRKDSVKELTGSKIKPLDIKNVDKTALKAKQKRAKRAKEEYIKALVEEKRKELEANSEDSVSEDELPSVEMLSMQGKSENRLLFPKMSNQQLQEFKMQLDFKETDKSKLKLNKCTARMQNNEWKDSHLLALCFLRRAIIDSLLKRRWDILSELLVSLIDNYTKREFTPFIRQMCHIMKNLDPRLMDSPLADQLNTIENVYNQKRLSTP